MVSKYKVGDLVLTKNHGLGMIEDVAILGYRGLDNLQRQVVYLVYLDLPVPRASTISRKSYIIAVREKDMIPYTEMAGALYE